MFSVSLLSCLCGAVSGLLVLGEQIGLEISALTGDFFPAALCAGDDEAVGLTGRLGLQAAMCVWASLGNVEEDRGSNFAHIGQDWQQIWEIIIFVVYLNIFFYEYIIIVCFLLQHMISQ